ncbi:MAG TPA: VWA domain-containing protein [Gemmatimonadaceae bacterium]|nr:VWA domain-containing protein [Gemmatimonadaceae bacterium]
MSELVFDYPYLLALGVVLPLLAVLVLRHAYKQRRIRLERLGSMDVISRLIPANTLVPPGWRMLRLGLASALVGVAVAGPRWGDERTVVHSSGIDMVLALDASLSMMAQDERPSRMERMKSEVRRLRAVSPGDRIAVLAFAGRSYVLSPFTIDAGALDLFLDNLDPTIVGQAGSSLARTIKQGVDLATLTNSGADRAIVVMSDGEAFEPIEDVVTESKRAGAQGISLVTVGFGTTDGATIPITAPNGSITTKKDENGQTVVTTYHPEFLKAAAEAAGGTFIEAGATDKAARVKSSLASLRTQSRATSGGETKTPRYQWFLFPAFALLLLDTALIERRGRRRRARPAAEHTVAAGLLFFFLSLTGCAGISRTRQATAAYRRGQFTQSASLFRDAITAGDNKPETVYNFGTALVAADSTASASEALGRLIDSKNDELRFRSLFNLGLADLKNGLATPAGPDNTALDSALVVYKKAILMRPDDLDAKWNYELALRKKKEGGGGGGGGGGGASKSPQGQAPQPQGGLGQQQAEQLLGSAAREERDVQSKKQKANRVEPPPGGKDW